MRRPRRTKPDGNQSQIVRDLKKLGFDVDVICDLPGLYDLVVSGEKEKTIPSLVEGVNREVYMTCSVRVEVKQPGAKLTKSEEDYWDEQKHSEALIIAESTEDVLRWFGRT